jgi:hypothetical protein
LGNFSHVRTSFRFRGLGFRVCDRGE